MAPQKRTPLSPDYFVTATLKNDLLETSVTFGGIGPDPDTLEITGRKAKKIHGALVGENLCRDAGYLGTHGPQDWTIELVGQLGHSHQYGAVLHRIINPENTPA